MAERIKLVQNDTRPALVVTIYDEVSNGTADLQGATVRLYFREIGNSAVKDTLTGLLLDQPPGILGRVAFFFNPNTLDTEGSFESEIEVTFEDGGIQTIFDTQKYTVRKDFQ